MTNIFFAYIFYCNDMLIDFTEIENKDGTVSKGKYTKYISLIPHEDFYTNASELPKILDNNYTDEHEVIISNVDIHKTKQKIVTSDAETLQGHTMKIEIQHKDKDNIKDDKFMTDTGHEAVIYSSANTIFFANVIGGNGQKQPIEIPKATIDFFEKDFPTCFLPSMPINLSDEYGIDNLNTKNMSVVIPKIKKILWDPAVIDGWKTSNIVLLKKSGVDKIIEAYKVYEEKKKMRKKVEEAREKEYMED